MYNIKTIFFSHKSLWRSKFVNFKQLC